MTARVAARGDVPALVDQMEAFYAEADFALDREWAAAAFAALLADPVRGTVWLLLDGESPAGYLVLTVRFSMECGGLDGFVDDLFVQPASRRRGLAGAGMRALLADAAARGLRAVHVEVGEENAAARALYARFGMAPRSDRRVVLTVVT